MFRACPFLPKFPLKYTPLSINGKKSCKTHGFARLFAIHTEGVIENIE
jgi:hypothetical protein